MPKNKLKLKTKRTFDHHFDEGNNINNENLDEYSDDLEKLETRQWHSTKSNSPTEKQK